MAQKYTLSFLCKDTFDVGGQLEKAVVQLTYGDSFEWKILKMRLLLASSTNLFDTSSGQSDNKIKAMRVLRLHC